MGPVRNTRTSSTETVPPPPPAAINLPSGENATLQIGELRILQEFGCRLGILPPRGAAVAKVAYPILFLPDSENMSGLIALPVPFSDEA